MAALLALVVLASCSVDGDGDGGGARAPADPSARDREQVDTDRAINETDQPSNDSEIGNDTDSAPFADPFVPPETGTGGRRPNTGPPTANGGSAGMSGGGRAGTTGGRASTATGGQSAGPVPPACTFAQGCECGDNDCLTCECLIEDPGSTICDSLCN